MTKDLVVVKLTAWPRSGQAVRTGRAPLRPATERRDHGQRRRPLRGLGNSVRCPKPIGPALSQADSERAAAGLPSIALDREARETGERRDRFLVLVGERSPARFVGPVQAPVRHVVNEDRDAEKTSASADVRAAFHNSEGARRGWQGAAGPERGSDRRARRGRTATCRSSRACHRRSPP